MSWLECETVFVAGKKTVIELKCKLCTQFENKIAVLGNYSDRCMGYGSRFVPVTLKTMQVLLAIMILMHDILSKEDPWRTAKPLKKRTKDKITHDQPKFDDQPKFEDDQPKFTLIGHIVLAIS